MEKRLAVLICVVVLMQGLVRSLPIMVFSGKLTPITPALPAPRMPVPYPPIPPAPVSEDPEPINSLLYRRTVKYGFRLKPVKTYASLFEIPADTYGSKDVLYAY